jgi:hypothetical protein
MHMNSNNDVLVKIETVQACLFLYRTVSYQYDAVFYVNMQCRKIVPEISFSFIAALFLNKGIPTIQGGNHWLRN